MMDYALENAKALGKENDELRAQLAEAQRETTLYRKQGISLLNDYEERVKERDAALERCKRLEGALAKAIDMIGHDKMCPARQVKGSDGPCDCELKALTAALAGEGGE